MSGIIVIAVAHGMLLTPALLAECTFIYCRAPNEATTHSTNKVEGDSTATMTVIAMVTDIDIGRRQTQIDDESESDE